MHFPDSHITYTNELFEYSRDLFNDFIEKEGLTLVKKLAFRGI